MRTRLQMTPEEARLSRSRMIADMGELAHFVGAPSSSIEAIDMAIREKYGKWVRAKEAIVPRAERWEIRFLRGPGHWLTTGQRLDPDPTNLLPGSRLPDCVRLAVPILPDGRMPMSLAPRREDLPRVANGRWRYTGPTRGYKTPTVTISTPAPRYGVMVYAIGMDTNPVIARFPANKGTLGAAIRRLAKDAAEYHAGLLASGRDAEKASRAARYDESGGRRV